VILVATKDHHRINLALRIMLTGFIITVVALAFSDWWSHTRLNLIDAD
jgi:hypothetical protein